MTDDAAAASAEEPQVTFNVKSSSDAKYVLTVPASMTVADIKTKLSGSDYADLPVDRQRLIYSGRVLKDHDTLAGVKIKDGHTVHLVKGAASNARQNPANQGSSTSNQPAAPQVPTNLATGTMHDPLAGLTGARYAGFHGLPGADTFGPDGGMGPPDPAAMLRMMDDPNFLQTMNEAMENPEIQSMLTNHPMLRDNPMLQQALQDPGMRRMMFSPEMMRMQLQMQQQQMNRGGNFPAPGVTDTTPQTGTGTGGNATTNTNNPTQPPLNPMAMFGGGAGGQVNPFAALFGTGAANPFAPNPDSNTTPAMTPRATASAGQGTPANPTPSTQAPNPFANLFGTGAQPGGQDMLTQMTQQLMQNPEMMRAAMQMVGGMGGAGGAPPATGDAAANPFGNLFGPGGFPPFPAGGMAASPPPPADSRPPEEVYESQLRQLNDMGFYEFERNVRALRRSGGSVQGAIEYLLGGS